MSNFTGITRKDFARRLGSNLAEARSRSDLSQEALGFEANLHRNDIGKLERGERIPRLDIAVRVAAVLGLSLDSLVEGITWEPLAYEAGGFQITARGAKEQEPGATERSTAKSQDP